MTRDRRQPSPKGIPAELPKYVCRTTYALLALLIGAVASPALAQSTHAFRCGPDHQLHGLVYALMTRSRVFLDYMTNPAALNREYANLQQIEVLKGPQGALYGRNAASGAFVITTRKPGNETSGQVKASAGQDDTYYLAGNIGGAISPDTVFYSLNAEYSDTDGFYTNEWLQRDDITDNYEAWSIGGRLIFEPSENLSIDTKLRYGEVDGASITFNAAFHLPKIAEQFGSPYPHAGSPLRAP